MNISEDLTSLYSSSEAIGTIYANDLPMSGMKYFEQIAVGGIDLELKHICARIELSSSVSEFVIESATLLNGANTGHYVPQSPLVEYTGVDVTEYATTTLSETPHIYLYENGGGAEGSENYTDIIIGGKYTISDGNIVDSYLKVKIEHGSPLTADIVRNTNYRLNVKAINKNNIGYDNIEDAKKGEYSDVQIDIEIGTDALNDMIVGNGDYYMSFSNSEYRAYIPTGTKNDLTAFSILFDKSASSAIDIATVKKEISLGANSTGITIVGDAGDKTSEWTAATDIPVLVNLADDANGTIIVRIGNLVREIKIAREQNVSNLPTAFNDGNYNYARFATDAPSWLKIATKNGTPVVAKDLHSNDGFKLEFAKDANALQSTELYLSRSSDEGMMKAYVEQYTLRDTPTFDVTGFEDNTEISYAGAEITTEFAVSSSSGVLDFLDETQSTVSASWEAEFSIDGGTTWTTTKPEWLDMPTSGEGTSEASTIAAAPQKLTLTGEALAAQNTLRAASPLGNEGSPYNLANSTGGEENQNTANSYLIGAPGTYKIPLIYGNAFTNGKPNAEAYEGATFVKHDGGLISIPEIEGAANATLAWQDAPGLITDVKLSGSNYLVFTVPQESIIEGNAVLAILDASGKVMWSWHIWVTPYTLEDYKEVQYKTGSITGSSKMLEVNLGWCSPGTIQYGQSPREVKVRLKQSGGALSPSADGVTYTQLEREIESMGNSPYYQWGRKDPMLPGDGSVSNTDKVQFGNLQLTTATGPATLADAIKNPNVMYLVSNIDWCSTSYSNLWSAKNSLSSTIHIDDHVKTVYDPSPVGYVVPPTSYFTGFTTTGLDSEASEEFNVKGSFDNGFDFYCGLDKTGSTIHLPSEGYRYYSDGNLYTVSTRGYYWGASPHNSGHGYRLRFSSSFVNPTPSTSRANGFPIRPVQE